MARPRQEPITDEARAAVDALLDPDTEMVEALANRSIFERMVAIVDELPAIGKDQRNQQQNFMYRGHDDVMAALNPLLAKHGVFLVPKVVRREPSVRTTNQGKALYEVSLLIEFTFYGLAGDSVTASVWGEGTDSGDKATSKATTMAFKSALAVVFAISTHELSDADAGTAPETVAPGQGQQATPPRGRETRPQRERAFDPGIELLPDAITGDGFLQRLADALAQIGPDVDWRATIGPYLRDRFHVETRDEIPEDRMPEYWRRVSNAVAKIAQDVDVTAFPPVSEAEPGLILAALSWAFAATPENPEVVFVLNVPTDETDEVPWVDDVKKALNPEDADDAAAADRELDDEARAAAEEDE
jgi:hypothetical protein